MWSVKALILTELGNQIEVLTVGDDIGEGSGEEEGESVPVCSMGRDVSTDDVCADAAVAPLQGRPKRDTSPSQVCYCVHFQYLTKYCLIQRKFFCT